jgi:hypothetical protein
LQRIAFLFHGMPVCYMTVFCGQDGGRMADKYLETNSKH